MNESTEDNENYETCPLCNGSGWESKYSTCRLCVRCGVVSVSVADEFEQQMREDVDDMHRQLEEADD